MIDENRLQNERNILINRWFANVENGTTNKDILLLICPDKKLKLEEKLQVFFPQSNLLYINNISKFNQQELKNSKGKNIVLVSYSDINLHWFNLFLDDQYSILFSKIGNEDHLQNLMNKYIPFEASLSNQRDYLIYFKKQDIDFMLNNIYILEDMIQHLLSDNFNNTRVFSKVSIKSVLFRGRDYMDIDRIYTDIEYYKSSFMLTSRLAIFIYKLCLLDANASDKEIGEYFKGIYGKSKVLNNKKFNIVNTRGYATKEKKYQSEFEIKQQIAYSLQQAGVPNDTIFNATGIDYSIINNLQ